MRVVHGTGDGTVGTGRALRQYSRLATAFGHLCIQQLISSAPMAYAPRFLTVFFAVFPAALFFFGSS